MGNRFRRATLIFNPNAGVDDWQHHIDDVATFWRTRGWSVSVRATQRPGHATELARQAAREGVTLALVAGGDGTIHEAAGALVHTDTILAPLPAGTANCLARDLKFPARGPDPARHLLQVSQMLLEGQVRVMDVGRCNGQSHWLLWVGVGLDGHIVSQVEPRSRLLKRFGVPGYFAKATPPFLTYWGAPMRVTVDDQTVDDAFLMVTVSNVRSFSGNLLDLNTQAVLDDGVFEAWLFRGRYAPQMLFYSLAIIAGSHHRYPGIVCLRGRNILIESRRPLPYHLDGEARHSTPVHNEVVPGALRLLTPSSVPAGLFAQPGEPLA
jgi:YegS/Rv2252/BmrU family lipid kinase